MAIIQAVEVNNSGFDVTYWRITAVQIDHQANVLDFNIHGYVSEEARRAGKTPLPVIQCRLLASDLGLENFHSITTKELYQALLDGKVNNENAKVLMSGQSI